MPSPSAVFRAALVALIAAGGGRVARAQEPNAEPAANPAPPQPSALPQPAALAPPLGAPQPSAALPVPPPPTTPDASLEAIQRQLDELRAQVRRLSAQHEPSADKAAEPKPLGWEPFWPWVTPPEGLSLTGYVQGQYETHQNSQDQLFQGGALQNQDRFSVRRARVTLLGEWEYAAIALELDANTTNGPQVDLRKAEASLQYRPNRREPPILMATLGQFDTPFGYELVESPRTRWFMERSTLSRAFWPAEPDLGLRLAGALGFFRWTIAPINGHPLGDPSYQLQDPTSAKDVVFRFGFDARPRDDFQIAGGISATRGKGFHAGTDATNTTLQWVDINGDGIVEASELVPVLGRAATPSQDFDRWAVGADLRAHFRSPLGVTKIYGEIIAASNMDRAMFVADPILTGVDQRELGFYAGVVQEIGPYGVVGFRYDFYDPNSDAFDKRAARLIPYSEAIKTFSPLVGLAIPDRARLVFEYDAIKNALARDASGVPTNLKDNVFTVRLQVQL